MKTITNYVLGGFLFFSIGLNVFNLIVKNDFDLPANTIVFKPELERTSSQSVTYEQKNTAKAMTALLQQLITRQTATEEKLQRLVNFSEGRVFRQNTSSIPLHDSVNPVVRKMPQNEFESVEYLVDDQIYSGRWTMENAMELIQQSDQMSHEQRTTLQLKVVQAINDGVLMTESVHLPLF